MRTEELVLGLILMDANMEFLEPHIATHMVVSDRFTFFNGRFCTADGHPLFNDTTLQNHWAILPIFFVILKLSETEE